MSRIITPIGATLFVLFCNAPCAAQGHLYSPPFLSTSAGHDLVPLFGYRPSMRYQMVDGELRRNRVAIKEVALRLNETTGRSPWIVRGRTWSSVVLRIADGNRSTFGKSFSANMSTTPTVVFSRSVTWPTVDVPLSVRVGVWGGKNGAYRFPFATPFAYGGTTDIVVDWTFRGGKLANNYYWGRANPYFYFFDGFGSPSSVGVAFGRGVPLVRLSNNSPGVTGRCNDSAYTWQANGAYLYGDGRVFGSAPKNPAFKNNLVLSSHAWLTAPNKPAIHGWGFATNEFGLGMGTGCNRLHISGAMVLFYVTASAGGVSGTRDLVMPWLAAYGNAKLTMQGAWSDSKTGRIGLTQGVVLRLPGHAPPNRLALRSSILESDIVRVQGPFTRGSHNPGLRYTH
jgi:hypothetical protein